MTAVGTPSGSHASLGGSRLAPGFMLGEYRLGQPLWPLRIADAYKAEGPKGPATVYVIKAAVAANPAVRDQIIAGTRTAAALPEHKHLVKTLAAGLTGDILWIATEEVDGQLVRDLLAKKRLASQAGLGVRAAGNLIAGVCAALSEAHHGALADESVVVNRTGRVRVIDLALGAGTAAAMVANLVPSSSAMAPEILTGTAPNGASDVYGIGALLYEVLVGKPLERGGPRPSDVVKEANKEIDELLARCCHRDPQKRFGRPEVLGAVVGDALGGGSGKPSPTLPPPLDDVPPPATAVEAQSLASSLTNAPAASGNAVIDRALASALADSTEKWLVTKGKLDYGPFSLADVVTQIEKGDIVAGNIIMDKDTGARVDVGDHPLLGPMVDVARQKRDDARRAQAEVKVQSQHKKRGFLLYGVIILGVAGLGGGGYLIYQSSKKAEKGEETSVVAQEGASLKVDLSQPKAPPPVKRKPGKRTGAGGNYTGNASDDLALDMSDEGEDGGGTETLPMGEVFAGYSRKAGALGGCLRSAGTSSVSIYISIDGKSGRVNVTKVNGGASGGLWACVNGVMRSIQFRQTSGGRTRAEFDINI